jgi:hypothetical protein
MDAMAMMMDGSHDKSCAMNTGPTSITTLFIGHIILIIVSTTTTTSPTALSVEAIHHLAVTISSSAIGTKVRFALDFALFHSNGQDKHLFCGR